MKGFRYLEGVATLAFDPDRCTGCGRCLEVCPHQVFERAGARVRLSDPDACMECGACALNCAARALTVDAGVGCASGLMNEWLRAKKFPGFSGGGC